MKSVCMKISSDHSSTCDSRLQHAVELYPCLLGIICGVWIFFLCVYLEVMHIDVEKAQSTYHFAGRHASMHRNMSMIKYPGPLSLAKMMLSEYGLIE